MMAVLSAGAPADRVSYAFSLVTAPRIRRACLVGEHEHGERCVDFPNDLVVTRGDTRCYSVANSVWNSFMPDARNWTATQVRRNPIIFVTA